jgi:L-alanine-DL-glutamate epimerase-like enolase superfamily enzyme
MTARSSEAPIEAIESAVYVVPTDLPEADGTLEWDRTTLVLARVSAGGLTGLGYSYTSAAAKAVIERVLSPAVCGRDALAIPEVWSAMRRAVRNLGQPGIAFHAISAVDSALWDLKGKLLDLPLVLLLGAARNSVPLYGSGGFTTYHDSTLHAQLGGWAEQGFRWVKMKVGRDAREDERRVRSVRGVLGTQTGLFVDANGAYDRKLALAQALRFAQAGVEWFEEPVSSDDLEGLRFLRDRGPAGMQIAAGEYGHEPHYFRRMLEAGAVDVLQADLTRCGGISGFSAAAAICAAHSLDLSCHCAPALHVHVACAVERLAHLEFFHDHARIEKMFFEGCPAPREGRLAPDRSRPGLGLELKQADSDRFRQG